MMVIGSGCTRDEPYRSDIGITPVFLTDETLAWAKQCKPSPQIKANLARVHATMLALDERVKRDKVVKTRTNWPLLNMWPFK